MKVLVTGRLHRTTSSAACWPGESVVIYDNYDPQVHVKKVRPAKAKRLKTSCDVRNRRKLAAK